MEQIKIRNRNFVVADSGSEIGIVIVHDPDDNDYAICNIKENPEIISDWFGSFEEAVEAYENGYYRN